MTAKQQAKRFTDTFPRYGTYLPGNSEEQIIKLLVEFVQYHVEEALKKAADDADSTTLENGRGKYITTYFNPNGPDEEYYIDKDSILNAYPKELIS